jgi:benzoate-CoA ligase family protein
MHDGIGWLQPPRLNAASQLVDAGPGKAADDALLYCFLDQMVTYGQFRRMINRCGNVLASLGIGLEDRVGLLGPDSPLLAAAFFGTVRAGAVAVPLSPLLTPQDYVFLLNDSRMKALLVAQPLLAKVEGARASCPGLAHLLPLAGVPGSLEERMASARDSMAPAETVEGDWAFWSYTSGTTGAPKAVMKTQYALAHKARHTYHGTGIGSSDRFYSLAAMFTDFGVHNLVATLMLGASQVLDPQRPAPERVVENIRKHRPTVFLGVPTMLARILALAGVRREDLASLTLCKVGAEPLPPAVYQEFTRRFGIEPLEMIGTSETSGEFIRSRPGRVRPGVLGEPVYGRELKVVDDSLQEVPRGQVGRLMVKDEGMASGYWNRPAATRKTFLGEWVLTDDRFVQDEEGYFHYEGRVDDIIDVAGRKVVPYEAEAALKSHPAVADAGVVGAKDEDGLTVLKAFVVPAPGTIGSNALAEDLRRHVKQTVAPFNCPRIVVFLDSLPRNALGKLERYRLK